MVARSARYGHGLTGFCATPTHPSSLDASMRNLLIGLTLLVMTSAPAPAGAAPMRSLKPHLISTSAGWVAEADNSTIAFGSGALGSRAVTFADDGTVQSVPAPAGCTAETAGAGHLLFDCGNEYLDGGAEHRAYRITDLAGSEQARADVVFQGAGSDGQLPGPPDAMGADWIHHEQSCHHCDVWSMDVNWHTGVVRRVWAHDLKLYENLDSPLLTTPLCAPLQLTAAPGHDFGGWPALLPVQVARPWALLTTLRTGEYGPETTHTLWRCGSPKPVALPKGVEPFALGAGWVALLTSKRGDRMGVQLLRLRDGRRFGIDG